MQQVEHEDAIVINDLTWRYGNLPVLDDLSLTVQKGTIYGLLGSSGCGKSTLLKIIIGRLIPQRFGRLSVLGSSPASEGHSIPGSSLGYAPQETALYDELSIEETLRFHGAMHSLDRTPLSRRISWLVSFLELPDPKRLVSQLSGGQKRRLSLAIALLHEPQLLILDEPTVGVDCVLRERIWKHLESESRRGKTIIVTTHYIEEARLADKVGMMRNGTILEQGAPQELLEKYRLNSLEDVFLHLCRNQGAEDSLSIDDQPKHSSSPSSSSSTTSSSISPPPLRAVKINNSSDAAASEDSPLLLPSSNVTSSSSESPKLRRIGAISKRKATQISRNLRLVLFELLVPAFQIFLFFTCIGTEIKGLNFAVINQDVGIQLFGQTLLNFGNEVTAGLDGSDTLRVRMYPDVDDARSAVEAGTVWGLLFIPTNFSVAFLERMTTPGVDPSIVDQGSLHLQLDMSSYQVSLSIEQTVAGVMESLAAANNITMNPIEIDTPIFGSQATKFGDFLAPGMIALITFAHSIGLTAISFVREKVDGTLDRIFASGATSGTVIVGHFLTQALLMLLQTVILLLLSVFGFHVVLAGGPVSLVWVVITLLLLGGVGMSLGLVISAISSLETEAVQLSLATFFPALLLSGVIWPSQSIPSWFAWLSLSLPTTHAANAMRSIMLRGWSIAHPEVSKALLIIGSWAVALFVLASILLTEKTHELTWAKRFANKFSRKKNR